MVPLGQKWQPKEGSSARRAAGDPPEMKRWRAEQLFDNLSLDMEGTGDGPQGLQRAAPHEELQGHNPQETREWRFFASKNGC